MTNSWIVKLQPSPGHSAGLKPNEFAISNHQSRQRLLIPRVAVGSCVARTLSPACRPTDSNPRMRIYPTGTSIRELCFGSLVFLHLVPIFKPISDRVASKSRPTLLRKHPDRPQPRLDQLRPSRDRKLRAPQPKTVLAFRIQMHFCWNPGLLQRDVVNQRVVDTVHGIILGLQQKRRRRLAGDRNIRIQLKLRRMKSRDVPDKGPPRNPGGSFLCPPHLQPDTNVCRNAC